MRISLSGKVEINMVTSKYFNIGEIVVTHGINEAMTENSRFAAEVNLSLQRYAVKDWGNLDDEDKQTNEEALKYPDDLYLLAAYETCKGKSGSLLIAYRRMPETMLQRYVFQVKDNSGFCGLSEIKGSLQH